MKTREMEHALLVLHAHTSQIELDQLFADDQPDVILSTSVGDALAAAAEKATAARSDDASPETSVDRFAAAQAFVLGVKYGRDNAGAARAELRQLGDALLERFDRSGSEATEPLITAAEQLMAGESVTAVRDLLTTAFGPALQIGDINDDTVSFAGIGANLATMLLDLATNLPECRTREVNILVDGQEKVVTFVEIDACTNAPYANCVHGVNPLHWPDCNPYFLSVDALPGTTTDYPNEGWSAIIKERVGPALNGSVYETDLAARYLEKPKLATVTFDLAPNRHDDGRVSVDRGFLSVTDEGVHRRFRTLKVYRIEDLNTPHNWVCALWCWQVVMSGWWCS